MDLFKRKKTEPHTFAEALMDGLRVGQLGEGKTGQEKLQEPLTERGLVLDSFARFAKEKMAEEPGGILKFEGGEILPKVDERNLPLNPRHIQKLDWLSATKREMDQSQWKATLDGREGPEVVFLAEAPCAEIDEGSVTDEVRAEFLYAFSPSVAVLFQKMVQAMQLVPTEYVILFLRDSRGDRSLEQVVEDISWLAPRFVVPLGATATQFLLGDRQRLATVHGKLFPLPKLNNSASQVMPLFHPGVISSNANMKKATWDDMQKLMQLLGKVRVR